jgi:hypothetical protein
MVFSSFQHCRAQRQLLGPAYRVDLFSTCGSIFVSRNGAERQQYTEELIELCGGRTVPSLCSASILVRNYPLERCEHINCVKDQWVLDSIRFNTLKPLSQYAWLWFGCGWWGVNGNKYFIYLWYQLGFLFALSLSLVHGPAPLYDYAS